MKLLALAAVSGLLLAGCSASPVVPDGRLSIVASTDVYGSIALAVGGNLVDVISLIDDPAQDPHSFEANARVQLELSKADIVIENGGGYDDFVDTMLASNAKSQLTVLNVTTISGKKVTADFNEHLWYDFPTVEALVTRLVTEFSAKAPAGTSTFENNAEIFVERLAGLEQREATLKQQFGGAGVAITEPVPNYLLEASGLNIVTPEAFSRAIEDGTDVAPQVLQQTLALFPDRKAAVLVYNEQTTGPQTEAVLTAAVDAGTPVVPVTETLPAGDNYLDWMAANLKALERALK